MAKAHERSGFGRRFKADAARSAEWPGAKSHTGQFDLAQPLLIRWRVEDEGEHVCHSGSFRGADAPQDGAEPVPVLIVGPARKLVARLDGVRLFAHGYPLLTT